jgi:hypothetical protein
MERFRVACEAVIAERAPPYLSRSRERPPRACAAGEGSAGKTLTRLAPLADLSRERER